MGELLSIEDIRRRYHDLMADTYDCMAGNNARKGVAVRIQINTLLGILIPMLRCQEITTIKRDLYRMRNKLLTLPFSHVS